MKEIYDHSLKVREGLHKIENRKSKSPSNKDILPALPDYEETIFAKKIKEEDLKKRLEL